MKAYSLRLLALSSFTLLGACADEAVAPKGPLNVTIAPLQLPNVAEVCYQLAVYNFDGDTVWTNTDVCSGQYGNGAGGDISYVGPCDATSNDNSITLVLDTVTDDNNLVLDDQNTSIDGDPDFVNPCPSTQPCELAFECIENADVFVEFNLTIMRDAEQGFFDVAVNFDDIFCSFKFDSCYDNATGNDIELLFGDGQGEMSIIDGEGRDHTAVFAVGCSAGPGVDIDTEILISAVKVTCGAQSFALPLTGLDQGNQSVYFDADNDGEAKHQVEYALYYGDEQLNCGEADAQVVENGKYMYSGGAYYALRGDQARQAGYYSWTLFAAADATQTILARTDAARAPESFTFVLPGNEASQTIYQYRTVQPVSCNKGYFNIALNMEDLPATGCTLSLEATAQDANDPVIGAEGVINGQGMNYPFVTLAAAPLEGCFAWAPGDMDGEEPGPLQVQYHTSEDMISGSKASIMCNYSNSSVPKALLNAGRNATEKYNTLATAEPVLLQSFARFTEFAAPLQDPCTGKFTDPVTAQTTRYAKSDIAVTSNKYLFNAINIEASEATRATFNKASAIISLGAINDRESFEFARYNNIGDFNKAAGFIVASEKLDANVTQVYAAIILDEPSAKLLGEAAKNERVNGYLVSFGVSFNQ